MSDRPPAPDMLPRAAHADPRFSRPPIFPHSRTHEHLQGPCLNLSATRLRFAPQFIVVLAFDLLAASLNSDHYTDLITTLIRDSPDLSVVIDPTTVMMLEFVKRDVTRQAAVESKNAGIGAKRQAAVARRIQQLWRVLEGRGQSEFLWSKDVLLHLPSVSRPRRSGSDSLEGCIIDPLYPRYFASLMRAINLELIECMDNRRVVFATMDGDILDALGTAPLQRSRLWHLSSPADLVENVRNECSRVLPNPLLRSLPRYPHHPTNHSTSPASGGAPSSLGRTSHPPVPLTTPTFPPDRSFLANFTIQKNPAPQPTVEALVLFDTNEGFFVDAKGNSFFSLAELKKRLSLARERGRTAGLTTRVMDEMGDKYKEGSKEDIYEMVRRLDRVGEETRGPVIAELGEDAAVPLEVLNDRGRRVKYLWDPAIIYQWAQIQHQGRVYGLTEDLAFRRLMAMIRRDDGVGFTGSAGREALRFLS
ncbi:hypothetical protein IAT38_002629 [Cryptococcus sp. DSM 104549]